MEPKPVSNPLITGDSGADDFVKKSEDRVLKSQDGNRRQQQSETALDLDASKDVDGSNATNDNREAEQVRFLQTKTTETNFVFLFGGAQRGKTVVTSSIINFLSSVEAQGTLSPFRLKVSASSTEPDHGRALFNRIRRVFAEQRFPQRTALVGDKEPIYVNVRFAPKNHLDADSLGLTFLEMPGEDLEKVDTPDGGYGELPARINAFFKVNNIKLAFILVTEPAKAFGDDQLMASFIDYVCDQDSKFLTSRFLLLLTKWDSYEGELSPSEFAEKNMRLTFAKLHESRHSIDSFSIGDVVMMDGKPFLKSFNPEYAKSVVNWLYSEFTGKPLYRLSGFKKAAKFIKRWL